MHVCSSNTGGLLVPSSLLSSLFGHWAIMNKWAVQGMEWIYRADSHPIVVTFFLSFFSFSFTHRVLVR